MELFDSYNYLQTNTISVLRQYPRFLTLLKSCAFNFDNLQDCINYLCENTQKDTSQGIWLDYIGWLVGITRANYADISDYFCVNQTGVDANMNPTGDINREKLFYFPTSLSTGSSSSLDDSLYKVQIDGKIAYKGGTTGFLRLSCAYDIQEVETYRSYLETVFVMINKAVVWLMVIIHIH